MSELDFKSARQIYNDLLTFLEKITEFNFNSETADVLKEEFKEKIEKELERLDEAVVLKN